jgi:hypothetical protein
LLLLYQFFEIRKIFISATKLAYMSSFVLLAAGHGSKGNCQAS